MARTALTFKQQDVTRALRAAAAAGTDVERVEIDKTGKIIVVIGRPKVPIDEGGGNEWDTVK